MKIGILQADSVLEEFQAEVGDYPEMFRTLLLGTGDTTLEFETYDVISEVYPSSIDECDAYLITGSKFSVYEDIPWIHRLREYVVKLHSAKKKLVGICFGHQLVALALGGKAESATVGWGVGVHKSEVKTHKPYMQPNLESYKALVSHQDQVTKLPPEALCLASSEFCPNSMMQIENHILTFQGHPEFKHRYSQLLIEMRRERIGVAVHDKGLESLSQGADDAALANWIVAFYRQ